jgi:hypothetical protein
MTSQTVGISNCYGVASVVDCYQIPKHPFDIECLNFCVKCSTSNANLLKLRIFQVVIIIMQQNSVIVKLI